MKKLCTLLFLLCSVFTYAQENTELKTFKKRGVFLDINVGFAERIGELSGEDYLDKQYSKSLKSGFSYDVSLYFRLIEDKNSFIGFKHNAFKKRIVVDDAYVYAPNGQEGYGDYSNNITIAFYGISYLYCKETANRDEFNFDLSLGYIHYKDKAVILRDYKITGASFGAYTSGSYHFRISDGFSVGPRVGLLLGTLRSAEIDGPNGFHENIKLDGDSKESLSRIDLSIGARIKF
ncbi:hypothetical protein FLJC2902T_31090 [Flavobacterium limnosediminis JC2902]|uniref:Outer membrane protein beta-barrel domain-containing protein n=2 Tax=Flavobacterium TaxID=237 RepID=V6SFE9_9FLAO|nr:hypothetical protein FLJC2902T_31090 [Flavobacterium limnosediminis JC2902]